MDKLRALQYFVTSAQEQSFSGAARKLDVSVPAVVRSISALERELGFDLFDRTVQGVSCTTEGARYLESCQLVLRELAESEQRIAESGKRPKGTLVVGAPPYLIQRCILPALPSFHARHPDIQIDIRSLNRTTAVEAKSAEVLILYGWQEHPDMVRRRVAQTRSVICASPAYWAAHGVPRSPKDLEQHTCLVFRDQEGTILDLWESERAGQKEVAIVRGWVVSDDPGTLLDAALEGEGVLRFSDLTVRSHIRSGRLVPVLLDWDTKHAPPIHVLYRASQRRTPRVRLFVDYVTELFGQLEAEREPRPTELTAFERPQWYRHRRSRASSSLRKTKAATPGSADFKPGD